MAINIEVKQRLKAIEDRLKALEEKPEPAAALKVFAGAGTKFYEAPVGEAEPSLSWNVSKPEKNVKLCPKCQKVPGYFFHVRSCKGP